MIIIKYKIKDIRLEKGLSARKLADMCGVSHSMISLIENNKRHPTLLTMCQIASALDVEVTDLFEYYVER